LGVGPAAFSKIKNLQTVNPPLEIYLDMLDNESPYGFRARVNEHAENWRKFAHELYNLKLDRRVIEELPTSVQSVLFLLKLTGNIHENTVTRKGRLFVHEITKTVVENLPFPLSNPSSIENREKYMEVLRMHR
ncbi:MAG: hypothetical protein GWO20_18495, partial [Candidatus Korarchaeota archaeon]|nr:hypothetical protein [Candidatus Korarchaeota archaeon]